MNALVLALGLVFGPESFEEDRLPRSLSESFYPQAATPAGEDHEVLLGLHFGGADAVHADNPSFLVGFEWRIHFLPWIGAAGSIDYQTREQVDNVSGAEFFQIPVMWSLLLSPPVDLGPFRPYGMAGTGLTVTYVSGASIRDTLDLNFLWFVGFGLEFKLGPNVTLDAGARYVWAHPPPGAENFDADWRQFTIGVLVKLPM